MSLDPGRSVLSSPRPAGQVGNTGMERHVRIRGWIPSRAVIVVALIVMGGSALVSACTGGDNDRSSNRPVEVTEIDLTELDVEMHYAYG